MELGALTKLWQFAVEYWPAASILVLYLLWDIVKFTLLRKDKRKEYEAEQALKLRDQLMQANDQAQGQVQRTLEIIAQLTEELNKTARTVQELERLHAKLYECIDFCIAKHPDVAPIFQPVMVEVEQWRRARRMQTVGGN